MTRAVTREELTGDATEVAPRLLNALVHVVDAAGSVRVGRILEVEAYRGSRDEASHAYRGRTARNATMFGRPGLLYVYRSYGIHWCANVVAGTEDVAEAVLLRALEPVSGLDEMRAARAAAHRDVDLANGPGKLCSALGITGADDGVDLCDGRARIRLLRDDVDAPRRPQRTTRVGITRAVGHRWRYLVPAHPGVSRGRPAQDPASRPTLDAPARGDDGVVGR